MRKLRELFRLRFEAKLSTRGIARSLGIGNATVCDYLGRARVAGLVWPLPVGLEDDAKLTALLFPDEGRPTFSRPEPDWNYVHVELKKKHVTKQLLWQEYLEAHPGGYHYSRFCDRYRRWQKTVGLTMRQHHRAGEKLFVDFSGDGIDVIDSETGEVRKAKLFVAVLGASNLTYVEPVWSEDLPTWVGCHVRAFEFFGGVTELVVPDNLRAAVTRAHRYEPDENPTYADLAQHYGFAILPARPRRPRDKAKVEVGVLLAERWILAALRHRRFSTLAEVKAAIVPLLEKLNARQMRVLKKSRREVFEDIERAALKPLPAKPYELALWKKARVNIDYHVELEGHWYSVPYTFVGKQVELRCTETLVEVLFNNKRVTSHAKSQAKARFTTLAAHMPKSHREYAEWTPSRILGWAQSVGPSCARLVEQLMTSRPHPQQGFRAALGVIRLADEARYGHQRVEKACARALHHRAVSYKSVAAILANRLEESLDAPERPSLPNHENVRGARYYH
ncbi:MAG: IS21 family transposase [Myxococcaceae bacterium]